MINQNFPKSKNTRYKTYVLFRKDLYEFPKCLVDGDIRLDASKIESAEKKQKV